jgi:hypothetical protein
MSDMIQDKIRWAVEKAAECEARHMESIPIIETFRGQIVWEGVVEAFVLLGNPKISNAYGWAVDGAKDQEAQYVAVLGLPPVDSALSAVRAWLVTEARKK